ncbi:hypothetical protein GQ55_6G201500 [Panicum hallii var. hallii]|uniref:Secreted protein n=1 Tax=Panicum hallii var. hallii TaxID=1504633 RepID=A0A2T7D7P3_9POAL|nr:hypothetical protein GQ55_6G201500 [Panicum hallii var. hallii]
MPFLLFSCCFLTPLACLLVSWTGFSQPHHHHWHHRLLLLPPPRQQCLCPAAPTLSRHTKSCFEVKTGTAQDAYASQMGSLSVNLALISLPACLPARCKNKNKIRCQKGPGRACAIRQQKARGKSLMDWAGSLGGRQRKAAAS